MYPVTRTLVLYPDLSTIYKRGAHEHGLTTYTTKCTDDTIDPSPRQPRDATFASLCVEGEMHAMALEALLYPSATRPEEFSRDPFQHLTDPIFLAIRKYDRG